VAYLVLFEGAGKLLEFKKGNYIHGAKVEHVPLYTNPPQRPWVELTDDEIQECWDTPLTPYGMQHAKEMVAKLKDKNCG
jgi:hypothetical protein